MTKGKNIARVPSGFTFIKSSSGISEYRLEANGLSVLLLEDHSAPVATCMVTYKVGSRNEALGHTGATHILEHLMFKGSKNFNKENGNDFTALIDGRGARWNATTWFDRTNYYELIPIDFLEDAMALEADRMRNALFNAEHLASEMTTVRNEFERGENDPLEALDKNVWATAYQAHPYHHSTIGWRSDIENVSVERLREFYDTFYWPNNATVTVIGDFDAFRTLELIENYFSVHPRSPHEIPVMYTVEPPQEGERRVLVRRTGEANIVAVAHKIPPARNEDTHAIQVLGKVLGGGKSSRLHKRLVDAGLATDIVISASPFHDNGLFIVYAFLTPGTKHETVEALIKKEYQLLKNVPVGKEELARAKGQIEAEVAYSRDGSFAVAQNLNEAIAVGDWTFYTAFLDKLRSVDAKALARCAKTYFDDMQSTVGYFIPIGQEKKKAPGGVRRVTRPRSRGFVSGNGGPYFYKEEKDITPVVDIAKRVKESSPLPGLSLMTMKTGAREVVTIIGSFFGGELHSMDNPMIPDILTDLLDQGTKRLSKGVLRNSLESMGASIEFTTSECRSEFQIRCLSKDISKVIGILGEMMREPALFPKDIEITKRRAIGQWKEEKDNTRSAAMRTFSQKLFPKKHPNRQPDIDEIIKQISKITRKDLLEFHKRAFGLGSMIIAAVGDIDEKVLSQALIKSFRGWRTSPLALPALASKGANVSTSTSYIAMPGKASVDVYIGQAIGINRAHPDFYALQLGVNILGLPGSFAARLMANVREKQGLTYGIYAYVSGLEDGIDGYWNVWGTFAPEMLERGLAAALGEIKLLDEKGATEAELREKKDIFMGLYKTGLATTRGIAQTLLANAEREYPVSYLDDLPQLIEKVTLGEVNAALKKYVDLSKLTIVAAGAIDKNGKPLKK